MNERKIPVNLGFLAGTVGKEGTEQYMYMGKIIWVSWTSGRVDHWRYGERFEQMTVSKTALRAWAVQKGRGSGWQEEHQKWGKVYSMKEGNYGAAGWMCGVEVKRVGKAYRDVREEQN